MNATIDGPTATGNRFAANGIIQDSVSATPIETGMLSFSKSAPRPAPADTMQRNCIKHYLNEIGKIPLLTREQEITLANRIKNGDLKARELMIKSNLRIVVKIAYNYQSKTIRLPIHLVDKISKIHKIATQLTEEFGREPSDEELSEVLDMPVNKIAHLKSVSARPASLNVPIGAYGNLTEFGEIVGDDNAISPYQLLSEKSLRTDLSELIDDLEVLESSIIKTRFGIEADSPLTLEEIGRIFSITRERVRQVQNIALSKLCRIMSRNERQLTLEEVEQVNRMQARMKIFREYYEETAHTR